VSKQLLAAAAFIGGLIAGTYLSAAAIQGHAQSAEVAYALDHAADANGVNRRCLWNIARRESGFRPWVDNYQGSGAGGLMQFKPGTYRWMAGMAGYPSDPGWRYDAWAAAHVAAWAIANPRASQGGLSHWGGWC
jgi:soluble lytic murein transglycosylase-like protein